MRKLLSGRLPWVSLALLLSAVMLVAAEPLYQLPTSVKAQRFRYDYPGTSGAVILADFALDPNGEPQDIQVRHGNASFRHVVASSLLRGWSFRLPEEASPEARVAAVVLFRQPQLLAVQKPTYDLPRVYTGTETPPQPRHLLEPNHPSQVNTDGVAVLAVSVDDAGAVTSISALFGSSDFIGQARRALQEWEFTPARHEGEPVASGLLVIIYFPQPAL